jgi:hypothetical protein
MSQIDRHLKAALRRRDPGPDFVAAVLRTIESEGLRATRRFRWAGALSRSRVRWATAALAACLMASLAIVEYGRMQETRKKGELAKEQMMLALRIASVKLRQVQKIVLDR